MKVSFLLLFVPALFFLSPLSSQNVTGEWYGVGKVKRSGDHNSYLSEMVLKQKGNRVNGYFSYFYRSAEIKTKVSGVYNPRFKVVELNARPILNFLAKNENGADCPMEGSFTLKITKTQTTLTGQFNPTYDYRITCPPIDIRFTKTRVKKEAGKKPEIEEDETEEEAATVDTVKKTFVVAKRDTVAKTLTDEELAELALKKRSFDLSPVIDVDSDTLKIDLYDNGEVDSDTISVFVNRQLMKYKQLLSDKAYSFKIPLDTTAKEISMFAENLGRIPPNTALAIIYAGDQRFELNLTSTLNKNATIRFRRKAKLVDPKNVN